MSETGTDHQANSDEVADRWRPHRAGVRNVWEYDDQVFSFADGRLILRGPNGSGKSNALALLFPFLVEGDECRRHGPIRRRSLDAVVAVGGAAG